MNDKPNPKLNAVVLLKEDLSPRYMILRVASAGWQLPDFIPGQFAVLGLPGSAPRCALSTPELEPSAPNDLIRRAYSVASSSMINEYMDFYVGLVSTGALTPRLFALNVGDALFLGPRVAGMFTLDQVAEGKNVVMIATGTGLAPYMSMMTSELTCGGPRRYAVLHGAYHSWDLAYRSELLNMQHLCENFTYIATIDQPKDEPIPWNGHVGWVQDLWKEGLVAKAWGFTPTKDNTDVFLCGNPAMINEMVGILAANGYCEHTRKTPGQIHIERF
jgi:ferredoxin--NADP+ reductase